MSKYVEYVPECCYTCEYVPHVREYVRIRELGGHVLNLRIRGSRIFRVLRVVSAKPPAHTHKELPDARIVLPELE